MLNSDLRWYILFINYEQGLGLRDLLLKNNVKNRIAPAPRAIQGELSCGMSLLIDDDDIESALTCIVEHKGEYHSIVPLAGQIKSHRDKYC